MTERTDPGLLKLLAAVELHRPVMYDKHHRVTDDARKVVNYRCAECRESVMAAGCKTWRTAFGQ